MSWSLAISPSAFRLRRCVSHMVACLHGCSVWDIFVFHLPCTYGIHFVNIWPTVTIAASMSSPACPTTCTALGHAGAHLCQLGLGVRCGGSGCGGSRTASVHRGYVGVCSQDAALSPERGSGLLRRHGRWKLEPRVGRSCQSSPREDPACSRNEQQVGGMVLRLV